MIKIRRQNSKNAFTLVELIVVIIILAILATIAFLSFMNQSSSARDSTRLSDLNNITRWIWIFQVWSSKFPMPDRNVKIFSSTWTMIWYQWEAWQSVLNIAKMSDWGWKDPLDKRYYTYSTNQAQSKYQIMSFLENRTYVTYNPFSWIDYIEAFEYADRYPFEKWDQMWIVLSASWSSSWSITYTPIQDITSIQASSSGFIISDPTINTWMVAVKSNLLLVPVTVKNLEWFTTPVNPVIIATDPELATSALYSSSDAALKTVFSSWSEYTAWWKANWCSTTPSIVNITDASTFNTYLNWKTLTTNRIYKIANGDYNLDWGINMTSCTAIIWQSRWWVIIKRNYNDTTPAWMVNKNYNSNSILTSITLDWNKANFTYANSYWIYWYWAKNSTLKNISITNNKSHWVAFLSYADNNILDDFIINNNVAGFSLWSNLNTLKNFQIYNNSNNWIQLSYATGNILENFKVYNNTNHWIHLFPNNCIGNVINNTMVFNNNANWIYLQWSAQSHNSFNNLQIFNNARWIEFDNAGSYNHFNNVMIYGNWWWSAEMLYWTNQIFNDNYVFNNWAWLKLTSSTLNKYYWISKIFSQTTVTNPFDIWTWAYLWWSDWALDNTWTADCSWHAKPGNNNDFWATCTSRWRITLTSTPIKTYSFWSNIINQKRPVRWNWTAFELYWDDWTDYFSSKKIGE
ncbi:MAG: hypothetical protein ACD_3C00179G0004 [uncultured bacterium (gcode 4)]|uniref:Prepilin-type N-terminal cleavage/methylation domain-containing protein n=1 Tax=uncultured bacterium (gcode 4) TaxID=1234023 RepID=K2F9B2_9BACT|nr:MAG: hypothetical protein ACD_3C00179G0004 [uncultured bacterium (gcode 4)]